MDVGISEKQMRILQRIAESIDETGVQPSYREICKHFGWSSVNAVASHVNRLEVAGLVEKHGSRAIKFDWKSYLRRGK